MKNLQRNAVLIRTTSSPKISATPIELCIVSLR